MRKLIPVLVLLILAVAPVHRASAQTGDPSGFADELNAARARRNLAPVAYDPGCATVAAENCRAMAAARAVGHFILGGLGQCAAFANDPRHALELWSGSPAHAAIIFAPDLVSVGYAAHGPWATISTRQSFAVTQSWEVSPMPAWTYRPRRVRWRR